MRPVRQDGPRAAKHSGPPDRVRIPYESLEPLSPRRLEALRTEAWRANDRYVIDVVEEFSFCPYARKGRQDGLTARYLHCADAPDEPTVAARLLDLLTRVAADKGQVVVQVVLPLVEVGPNDWHRFCQDLVMFGNTLLPRGDHLATAALHPELPFVDGNPFSLIPLFRRSPDPTIQWVRMDAVHDLYAGRESGTKFLPLADLDAYLDGPPPPKPLYDRIAETNLKMARRLGTDHLVRTLAEIRDDAQRAYAEVLLDDRYA